MMQLLLFEWSTQYFLFPAHFLCFLLLGVVEPTLASVSRKLVGNSIKGKSLNESHAFLSLQPLTHLLNSLNSLS